MTPSAQRPLRPAGRSRRVLVTGSSGAVGSALCAGLPAAGWLVRQIDRVPPAVVPEDPRDSVVGDVFDPATLQRAIRGCSAVVHLAAVPGEASIEEIAASHLVGTAVVLDAVRQAGIKRLVFASSNHAVGFTPRTPAGAELGSDIRPRPDTYYGVGKVAGEALCSLYADRFGISTACVRIGSFEDRPRTRRHLSTWLSPGDLVRVVDACLRAPHLTYAVLWGISANTRRWWDLAAGYELGYEPQDDAEDYAQVIRAVTREHDPDDPEHAYVGGSFTQPELPPPLGPAPTPQQPPTVSTVSTKGPSRIGKVLQFPDRGGR